MNIRIFSKNWVWLAGALLTLVLFGGLKISGRQDFTGMPSLPQNSGEVRQLSLTGFSDRPLVVRKKIFTALPATAFAFVVTKKIVTPSFDTTAETASSAPRKPVPATSAAAAENKASENNSAADPLPPLSASLSLVDRWQESKLISRLMNEIDASPSISPVSTITATTVSASVDAPREKASMSVVTGRAAVSPEIIAAANRTAEATQPAADHPQEERPALPTPSAPEAAAIHKQPPSLPYSLQLSSCRSLKNAQYAAADFRKMGLDPFIVNVYLKKNGGSWWRVLSGQYPSVEAALRAKRDLKLSGSIVKRTRFANLIGEYETRELTIEMKNRLESLGFSAYTVENADHGYRLFVGAFTRKSQAAKQALELQTKGMMCQVVAR